MRKNIRLGASIYFDQKAKIYRAAFNEIPNMTAYDENAEVAREKLLWLLKSWIYSDKAEVMKVFTGILLKQQSFDNIEFENYDNFIEERDDMLELAMS